ncbi:sigma-70 family RNA polymerase sigma factor [Pseudomonas sp. PDM14]|uniref:sigma-70 family RNA polymerase sigma factor n=1 Tax=Pseudomonas sp. PDM14 TaxID=2769288 RepID=UPI00177F1DC3|nr:sigma-70 family RNA polymerase sigma factor [Pseudomonas sp. PDM14]MBD9483657.1 sigma-70 family RNA polymerase sigma factor [Pseudomonas sp. PDM14]
MSSADTSLHDAVHQLYQSNHAWLYGWLRKRLGCADNAADLAQDTFARILASRRVLEAREPRAYLTTVAKGLLINWYRRQSLERAYLDALADLPEELAPSLEQRLIILETLHEIDSLLANLPEPVRRAFLLSQIDGLTYPAIAEVLGVSLGSVKRYMQQAFRQCLELMA